MTVKRIKRKAGIAEAAELQKWTMHLNAVRLAGPGQDYTVAERRIVTGERQGDTPY